MADQVELPTTMPTPGEVLGAVEEPAEGETAEQAEGGAASTTEAASAAAKPAAATTTTNAAPAPAPAQVAAAAPPPMFAVCGACHSTNAGDHGIGPSLAGVFGSKAASKSGFDYSAAMKDSGLTWNEGNLNRYLENPREVVPGTTMAYAGLKNAAQRQAVIDYLKGL